MHGKLKIIHYKHTGQLKPHEHTSYITLAVLLLLVGVLLTLFSLKEVFAQSPPPQAESVGLTGTMPGTPPKKGAVITSPTNNQRFRTSPIDVSGTCPSGLLVEIFKNNIFAGSVVCGSNGRFSVKVDLLYGKNVIMAKVFDALNQAGPDSNSVTVYYDIDRLQLTPEGFLDFTGNQLLLNTDAVYRGKFPNQTLNVPISILGGTPPFAINIDWGDSTNKVIPRNNNTVFNATHVYKKPGIFQISIQGSDSKQLVAFLSVAAIINGQPAPAGSADGTSKPVSGLTKLLVLWPLFAIAATAVISFWLGERREKRILTAASEAQKPLFGPPPPAPQPQQ